MVDQSGYTDSIVQDFAAVVADHLEDLFDLLDESRMIDGLGQLNVAKVTRTLCYSLQTRRALEAAVDRSEAGIIETVLAGFGPRLVHRLRVHDMSHTHVLDLFG